MIFPMLVVALSAIVSSLMTAHYLSSNIAAAVVVAVASEAKSKGAASGISVSDSPLSSTSTSVVSIGYLYNGTSIFRETARSLTPITDKVKAHEFQIMYGTNLLPYYYSHPTMKMLEIGLGCAMKHGGVASVQLWKTLFPHADLWEADYNAACVKKWKHHPTAPFEGIHVLTGDQGDPKVLDRWIEESDGGNFDVIIDDGGHRNCMIYTSFQKLWPILKPGGLYFIEDLHVAKWPAYRASTPMCDGANLTVPDKLKELLDGLVYNDVGKRHAAAKTARRQQSGGGGESIGLQVVDSVEFLFCQSEACVLRKRL